MRRFHFPGGIDPVAVMECVLLPVLVPNPDIAALDPHAHCRFGSTIPTGQRLGRPAICLLGQTALIELVEGCLARRRWWWNRGRRRRCGELRRRCSCGRRRWLRGASGGREEQPEYDKAFHPFLRH